MTSCEEVESVPTTGSIRNKHQWTPMEDEVLIASLYEMYQIGTFKADTGFKAGYLNHLEKMMEAKMPGCGLKGVPHMNSRIRTLKSKTFALAELLNASGFGWNAETHSIVCEKNVYDNWVKSHPAAKGLWLKPFPHYDTLIEIYGKDRANGKGATTLAAEEEEIEGAGFTEQDNTVPVTNPDGMDISESQVNASNSESARKRSRKNSDGLAKSMTEVSAAIKELVGGTLTYLSSIGSAMKEDNTPSREVAKALHNMDGLSLDDILLAAEKIINDSFKTSVFLESSEEKRREMVASLLKK